MNKLSRALVDWDVFTPQTEQKYDSEIAAVISRNLTSFKEACKLNDLDNLGIISFKDFEDVLQTLEIEFSQE